MPSKTARGSNSGWKAVQSKTRVKKQTKLALIVLGLILLLIILAQGIRLSQTLFSPWKDSSSTDRIYKWDGQFNINLVVKGKDTSVVSFNPKDQTITIINIPDQVYLDVPYGYGQWSLRSVFDLGESVANLGGNRLLKDTLVSFLGLPIDGFLHLGGEYQQKGTEEIVEIIRKSPYGAFNMLSHLKTDLTLWEILRFQSGISSVRFDKVDLIDLGEVGVLDPQKLPDGTQILVSDEIKIDSVLSNFIDPILRLEGKTVAIFNATDIPQLAQKASRLVTNMGADVIITSNTSKRPAQTIVFGEKSKSLDRLLEVFDSDGKISVSDQELVSSRAQINIVLGEDYINQ